jgi:hypothetical protein
MNRSEKDDISIAPQQMSPVMIFGIISCFSALLARCAPKPQSKWLLEPISTVRHSSSSDPGVRIRKHIQTPYRTPHRKNARSVERMHAGRKILPQDATIPLLQRSRFRFRGVFNHVQSLGSQSPRNIPAVQRARPCADLLSASQPALFPAKGPGSCQSLQIPGRKLAHATDKTPVVG